MEFKRFSAGEISYGSDEPDAVKYAPGVTNVNFSDQAFDECIKNQNHPNHKDLKSFIEALGVCHTVITETKYTNDN